METEKMQEELQTLEVRNQGLQLLVGELLVTNQQLRQELSKLKPSRSVSEPAIHLQPHQDR
jgi:hypothetical protein